MEWSSLRDLFLPNRLDSDGGVSDQLVSAAYGNAAVSTASGQSQLTNEASGYPLLLQEYLRQQQQTESTLQQPTATGAMDSNTALAGLTASHLASRNFASFDSSAGPLGLQDGRNNWVVSPAPPSVTGTQTSSTGDLSTSDRMLLERLQVRSNASFRVGPTSAVSHDPYAEQGILGPWSERSAGLLGSMVCSEPSNQPGKVKRARRKQPKDKPKRPLSAYNIFFKEERARLLNKVPCDVGDEGNQKRTANGKIGFENLAKIIGGKWQDLRPSDVEYYKRKASSDMQRYKDEMDEYNKKHARKNKDDEDDEDSANSAKRQKTT